VRRVDSLHNHLMALYRLDKITTAPTDKCWRQTVARIVPNRASKYQFHLTGGALCLDFTNTRSWRRGSAPIERLTGYDDLVVFARQAKIIDAAQTRALRDAAARQPRRAARVYREALKLRTLIDRIFTTIVDGRPAAGVDLAALNARFAAVSARMCVVRDRRAYAWHDGEEGALDQMLAPVVRSAAALLTSAELAKLRRCGAADCGWLFIDLSRNQRRRWCDMRVCGNRAKARRHHHRTRRRLGEETKVKIEPLT
jgi:predicted RNA-binding Zn ribbon-like protein